MVLPVAKSISVVEVKRCPNLIEKDEFEVAESCLPYSAVPVKLSFAACQTNPCLTRRTSCHPPPCSVFSQKETSAAMGGKRMRSEEKIGAKKNNIQDTTDTHHKYTNILNRTSQPAPAQTHKTKPKNKLAKQCPVAERFL